jgi:hypothetical protein
MLQRRLNEQNCPSFLCLRGNRALEEMKEVRRPRSGKRSRTAAFVPC